MRLRLSLVGQEINVIGSETVRLGVLTNANDTAEKIQALRSELDLRDSDRSSQIEELKGELRNVLEQRVRSALEGVIRQTIANNSGLRERVAQQIASQIPVSLLTQLRKSKLLLQQIQMDLYNSEARRQNAAIHGHSLTEPIRPLLRPLAMPLTSPTNGMVVPVTPAQPAPPPVTPATPHQRVSSISSASSFESNSSTMSWEIEAPTPSDRFPRDLREFASLDDETLHSLLFDYRLESQEDRLKDMNAFLTHINVPFQVTPVSAHPGKSGKPQVVFTAAH
ncbi:hypothetical protein NEOLEDRAFT_1136357 [Neolentinus lepideus HHB14362 ss-1]|uniref:Uncharacterized protein n=1 Tax=Neolentinus lepideus HHB14362 ss-1 TaxID=1314782 RepID=A0A165RBK2_9AGAM|nr:hypothetical protein NEOLEDRAFT_1136357 [Neolentinus lepideus HHB14362 ss-1]